MFRFFLNVKQLFSREGRKATKKVQPLKAVFQSRNRPFAPKDLQAQKSPVFFEALEESYEVAYKRPKHKINLSQAVLLKNQESSNKQEEPKLNTQDQNRYEIKNQNGLDPDFPIKTKISPTEGITVKESLEQSFIKTSLQTKSKRERSIDLNVAPLAYGYYFPVGWSEEEILTAMDPSHTKIVSVKIVRDGIGAPTGKVAITFQDHLTMDRLVGKYNEDFLTLKEEVYRVVLKPFVLKTALELSQKKNQNLKYPVKVTNLDFEMPLSELQRLAADFGVVEHIDMPLRPGQTNMGFATVYMGSLEAAKNFYYFIDQLFYNERTLKAQIVNKKKAIPLDNNPKAFQKQMPNFLLQINRQLVKKEAVKEAQRRLQMNPAKKTEAKDSIRLRIGKKMKNL